MLLLAQPLDTSDPLLMSADERKAFLKPLPLIQRCRPVGKTGYRGVTKNGNLYAACVYVKKKRIHVGTYTTASEAAYAHDIKAREVHGEWADLNFPEAA